MDGIYHRLVRSEVRGDSSRECVAGACGVHGDCLVSWMPVGLASGVGDASRWAEGDYDGWHTQFGRQGCGQIVTGFVTAPMNGGQQGAGFGFIGDEQIDLVPG